MRTLLPISLCAGLASALFFGSLATGSLLALALYFIAPFPLFFAGLGWGHKAASLAGTIALVALFFLASPQIAVYYLSIIALPATVLSYFALMSREDDTKTTNSTVEWYPLGRLVVIAALFSAGFSVLLLSVMGGDLQEMYKNFGKAIAYIYSTSDGFQQLKNADPEKAQALIDFSVRFAPTASSAIVLLTTLANMFAAQKILSMNGKAIRDQVDVGSLAYPQTYLISFAAGLCLTFLGGLPGFFGGAYAAVGIMAYAIIGFIVIHKITAGQTLRPLMLGLAYVLTVVFTWLGLLVMMGIGLLDAFFNLREKFGNNNET